MQPEYVKVPAKSISTATVYLNLSWLEISRNLKWAKTAHFLVESS